MLTLISALPLLTGCSVDDASANGELGRMRFAIYSDHYLDERDLTEASIVTGHTQYVSVGLTEAGQDRAGNKADEITYTLTASGEVTLEQPGADGDSGEEDGNAENVSSFWITALAPETVTIESVLDGEVFDRIELSFDAPDALALALFARAPWVEDFTALDGSGPFALDEGTQLAYLGIPMRGADRLLGDMVPTLSAEPMSAVVPAVNVEHVNEDEAFSVFDAASLYFIEPGAVSVVLTDVQNAADGAADFTVAPIE
jgi:hypothetical protein